VKFVDGPLWRYSYSADKQPRSAFDDYIEKFAKIAAGVVVLEFEWLVVS
jgi:hypothetical protein